MPIKSPPDENGFGLNAIGVKASPRIQPRKKQDNVKENRQSQVIEQDKSEYVTPQSTIDWSPRRDSGAKKPVMMPSVAFLDQRKRHATAHSASSGVSGAEIHVQVEDDNAFETIDDYRKSELARAITKVLNMSHQPVHVSDVMKSQQHDSELPTAVATPGVTTLGRMYTGHSSVDGVCINKQEVTD